MADFIRLQTFNARAHRPYPRLIAGLALVASLALPAGTARNPGMTTDFNSKSGGVLKLSGNAELLTNIGYQAADEVEGVSNSYTIGPDTNPQPPVLPVYDRDIALIGDDGTVTLQNATFGKTITMCMNRNPPEGTVITKSVRQASCGDQCESEIQTPAGQRMLICRGQAIPKGYTLELLTTTPDCSCYGSDQNAYMIEAQTPEHEFRQALPL